MRFVLTLSQNTFSYFTMTTFNSEENVYVHISKNWTLLDERKTVVKYLKLCESVEPFLLAYLSSYMVESGFSHVNYLLRRRWRTLYKEHSDFRLESANWYSWSPQCPQIRNLPMKKKKKKKKKNSLRIKGTLAFIIHWFFFHVNCIKHW